MSLDELEVRRMLREFAAERDWEQFHTPKNLIMALSGEVGELAAELQWLSDQQITEKLESPQFRLRIEEEVADVLNYLIRFADICDIDLDQAIREKLETNRQKYPVDLARGSARKYTELNGADTQ